MILSDTKITEALAAGDIVIDPFDQNRLGANSYDVCLGRKLVRYANPLIDAKVDNPIIEQDISEEGVILCPNTLYLGVTNEIVGSRKYVPWLDGKSSSGRLGISVHVTAGRGDVGFINYWTMEIWVVQTVRVYAGMPIGQFTFFETHDVSKRYDQRPSSKYGSLDARPRPSAMWRNFQVVP